MRSMRSTTTGELLQRLSNRIVWKPALISSTQVCEPM